MCWWENNNSLIFANQEKCVSTHALTDPGFYSKCPELQQQLWSHCGAVPQTCEVPLLVSSRDHTDTAWRQWCSPGAGSDCRLLLSLQLAAKKFLWFTTQLWQFCKSVKAKQGRVAVHSEDVKQLEEKKVFGNKISVLNSCWLIFTTKLRGAHWEWDVDLCPIPHWTDFKPWILWALLLYNILFLVVYSFNRLINSIKGASQR